MTQADKIKVMLPKFRSVFMPTLGSHVLVSIEVMEAMLDAEPETFEDVTFSIINAELYIN